VFVHGDLWQGNTLWEGDTLTGVVDWDCAGSGAAGIDLGSLRCDAWMAAGPQAAAAVLAGYEEAAGRPADDVAYWDVAAALCTPPTIGWFTDAIRDQGRTDLDQPTLLGRRDAFLRDALHRLG
jgi:Ser/Thr protein kinase RdoA (MazF antagonist)